jgi:hypothetical protein
MAKVKFQVVLENVELSKAQIAAIQKEINSMVAGHLLKTKMAAAAAAPGLPSYAYKIPKEWLGIWIKTMKLPTDLAKFGGKFLSKLPGLK